MQPERTFQRLFNDRTLLLEQHVAERAGEPVVERAYGCGHGESIQGAPRSRPVGRSPGNAANSRMLQVVPIPALQDNYIWLIRGANDPALVAVVDPGDAAP